MSERTFNQISQQYDAQHTEPTVLIRRSDETIQTAYLTERQDEQGRRYVRFVDPIDGLMKGKPITAENLTDEAQAGLAGELADDRYDAEALVDTTPRDVLAELLEQEPSVDVALGKTAVHDSVDIAMDASHEVHEETADSVKAAERIKSVIGETGTAQNDLAEVLVQLGDDPSAIRHALAEADSDVRKSVSDVLSLRMTRLLNEGGHFHERVQDNNPNNLKAPNGNHGYENAKYRSDEYVVLLALAKLDGSFDTSREKDYDDLPDNHVHQGQHRQAADVLLASFADENKPAKAERDDAEDERLQYARRAVHEMLDASMADVRTVDSYADTLTNSSYADMIDLQQTEEVLHMTRSTIQRIVEHFRDADMTMRRLSMEDEGGDARYINDKLDEAAASLRRATDIFEGEVDDQVKLLLRKTDEARYERHMQDDYRSSLRLRAQELTEISHSAIAMLHRIEL